MPVCRVMEEEVSDTSRSSPRTVAFLAYHPVFRRLPLTKVHIISEAPGLSCSTMDDSKRWDLGAQC